MPRGKKNSGNDHHGLLHTVEQQYLAALKFSRDQINQKISALETFLGTGLVGRPSKTPSKKGPTSSGGKSASGKRKPRDYDMLKAKIKGPMTMEQLVKATGKKAGTLQQTFQAYPGLFKSDGKRPATYTFDSSR